MAEKQGGVSRGIDSGAFRKPIEDFIAHLGKRTDSLCGPLRPGMCALSAMR